MITYVKAEYNTSKGNMCTMSVSCKAVSSLAGMRKLERHIAICYGVWPDSVESSTRQHYTSLAYIYPLVSINNNGIMRDIPCIQDHSA